MTRPLPEDVARTARAYLAALVPPAEVSDAWHELVADTTYWGERELVPVVRLAHQVVLGHQRVTPEVAILALREIGLDQPATVARVLDVDEDTARGWTTQVVASLERGPAADVVGRFSEPPRTRARSAHVAAPQPGPEFDEADADVPAPTTDDTDDTGGTGGTATTGDAVRIGFGEDGPWPDLDDLDSPASTTPRRGMVVAAVVAAVLLLLVLWLLLGR